MTEIKTAQEAVDVLVKFARVGYDQPREGLVERIMGAVAFLENKHVYASRFKIDTHEWCVIGRGNPHQRIYCTCLESIATFFPTREEAQAECDRRNGKP